MPIHHIIWDWNGTLLDDTGLCIDVMNGLLGERGMPLLTRERYHQIFDFPVIEYYRRLGFDFDKDPFAVVGAEFIRRYEQRRTEARLHIDALATLACIRDLGLTQSVLSAYSHHTLEELLTYFGVRSFFSGVMGSDNVYAHGKKEQGLRWIKELKLAPETVVLIGDTIHDFEVAQAMGCRCLLIANGYHPRSRLEPLGTTVLDHLSQAPAWLRHNC